MNESILDVIKRGEDSFTEFKSADFNADSLAKEFVAFANFQGGDVYIGINDEKTISGANEKGMDEKIANICRNNIIPDIIPEITR